LSVTVRCGQHNVCIVHGQGYFYGILAQKNVYYMVLTEIRLSFNFSLTIQLYGWNAERKLNYGRVENYFMTMRGWLITCQLTSLIDSRDQDIYFTSYSWNSKMLSLSLQSLCFALLRPLFALPNVSNNTPPFQNPQRLTERQFSSFCITMLYISISKYFSKEMDVSPPFLHQFLTAS